MSNNPKIVLTGANGFLGSHLVDRLLKEEFDIHCIVRKSSNLKWLKGKNIQLHTCGIEDPKALKEVLEGATYIFHLAGTVSSFDYEGYHKGNVDLTKILLDAALASASSIKNIVVTSSQAVSGPSTTNQLTESVSNPVSWYGKSKLEQELLCKEYYDRLPISIARPSIIYGPRDVEFLEFIQTVKMGIVPLVGKENKPISSIYVEDLVEGLYLMAISNKTPGEVYHLASFEVLNWRELGAICALSLGKKPIYLKLPHFAIKTAGAIAGFFGKLQGKAPTFDAQKALEGVQAGWVCNVEKAKRDFNFEAKKSAKIALKETIDWYKENQII